MHKCGSYHHDNLTTLNDTIVASHNIGFYFETETLGVTIAMISAVCCLHSTGRKQYSPEVRWPTGEQARNKHVADKWWSTKRDLKHKNTNRWKIRHDTQLLNAKSNIYSGVLRRKVRHST